MIRLILADLVFHARVWLGILTVIVATGFVAGIAAGLIETGVHEGGEVQEGLGSTSSVVIIFTGLTALIVLGSAANLTVSLQQRSYALWQLVGIRPLSVAGIVLAQLAVVGILGALIGCAIAAPAIGPVFAWTFREWPGMQDVEVRLGGVGALVVAAAILVVVLLGGLRGARRASRTRPIEALREPEPHRIGMGWFRVLLLVAALSGAFGLSASMRSGSFSQVSGQAPLLTPLIAAVFAAAGPVVYPLALRAWTALVPTGASATWFLARNSARYRLSQSGAAIGPLMVAIALAGGLYTSGATLAAARPAETGEPGGFELAIEGVVLLLGGPLLLSATAAAATVFMAGHARERESALVRAAGSTGTALILTAVWEAVVYAVTAALLGTAATVVGGTILAASLDLPFPVISFRTLGMITAGGFALILVATVAPSAAALRHEIPRTLAVE